jgi:hypothetical protein
MESLVTIYVLKYVADMNVTTPENGGKHEDIAR